MKKKQRLQWGMVKAMIGGMLLLFLLIFLYRHFLGQPARTYLTVPVARADIENTVQAIGTLRAFKQVDVGARVTGQVKTIPVDLGEVVKKGQLLAEIDPVLAKNALQQAQLNAENLVAQQHAKAAQLQQMELAWQRQRTMLAEDATSRQEAENAEAQFKVGQASLAALAAQIKKARVEIERARTDLEYTHITAPIDGEVVAIVTQEGQTVIAQQQVPVIMKLADLRTMTVEAQVPEADVIRVRTRQEVHFNILGNPDQRYYGALRTIEPAPLSAAQGKQGSGQQAQAVFYNALFEVPNPQRQLRIGMTAQVSIVLDKARAALTIPVSALVNQEKGGRAQVHVLDRDGAVQTRRVQTGINNRVQVQILSGLKEGERVIIGEASEAKGSGARRSRHGRGVIIGAISSYESRVSRGA